MATLTSLPPEIFQAIVFHLTGFSVIPGYKGTRSDLFNLSRTSKSLRSDVEPLFYHDISFEWKEHKCLPPIHLLVRTIMNRPALTFLIHHLAFCDERPRVKEARTRPQHHLPKLVPPGSIWEGYDKSSVTPAEYEALEEAIAALCPLKSTKWLERLEQGEVDVWIALLITRVPNLRSLWLDYLFQQDTEAISTVLKEIIAAAQSQLLLSLDDMTFGMDIPWVHKALPQSMNVDTILSCFFLPSLKSVYVYLSAQTVIWPNGHVPVSKVTYLELAHSQPSVGSLGEMVKATPRLHRLDYTLCFDVKHPRGEHFDCGKLGAALQHVQDTLQSLLISIDPLSPVTDREELLNITGTLPSLRDYEALSDIMVPLDMLMSWNPELNRDVPNLLPPHLEKLCLTDDSLWSNDTAPDCRWNEFVTLYAEQPGHFPFDLQVNLRIWSSYSWSKEEKSQFEALCTGAGIRCDFDCDVKNQWYLQ